MRFSKSFGRCKFYGYPLAQWHWGVKPIKSYMGGQLKGINVCIGRYNIVLERGKALPR